MKLPQLTIGNLTARLPIVQGGMGVGVSLSGLAGAVANAGGIGTISGVQIGFREPDFEQDPLTANLRAIGKEIQRAREIAPQGIIGMNFMTVMRHYDEYVREAVKNGIDFIVSGAGLPLHLPKLVENSRTCIIPIVSSARACKLILRSWKKLGRLPDAVVVEGPMAGGHLGFKFQDVIDGTMDSLEHALQEVKALICDTEQKEGVSIPVIAGGGISSHEDVQRMFSLGANGVQVGTRFVATVECDACPAFKRTYLEARPEDIRIIKSPVGLAARGINNEFMQRAYAVDHLPVRHCYGCLTTCNPATTHYCISRALIDSVTSGDGLVFSGARAGELSELTTVPKLMQELAPDNN